ncbi:MAG: translation initiation factor IF-1 [Deltaproteobacteria bacterium]|nr:translation initiation factor IF-1 [Deltaproteobacteria bacterium]
MVEVVGSVVDLATNRMYSVRLDGGTVVSAHLGNDLQMRIVRLIPGDRVVLKLSDVDPSRGRIVRRSDAAVMKERVR